MMIIIMNVHDYIHGEVDMFFEIHCTELMGWVFLYFVPLITCYQRLIEIVNVTLSMEMLTNLMCPQNHLSFHIQLEFSYDNITP